MNPSLEFCWCCKIIYMICVGEFSALYIFILELLDRRATDDEVPRSCDDPNTDFCTRFLYKHFQTVFVLIIPSV